MSQSLTCLALDRTLDGNQQLTDHLLNCDWFVRSIVEGRKRMGGLQRILWLRSSLMDFLSEEELRDTMRAAISRIPTAPSKLRGAIDEYIYSQREKRPAKKARLDSNREGVQYKKEEIVQMMEAIAEKEVVIYGKSSTTGKEWEFEWWKTTPVHRGPGVCFRSQCEMRCNCY